MERDQLGKDLGYLGFTPGLGVSRLSLHPNFSLPHSPALGQDLNLTLHLGRSEPQKQGRCSDGWPGAEGCLPEAPVWGLCSALRGHTAPLCWRLAASGHVKASCGPQVSLPPLLSLHCVLGWL